MDPRLSSTRIPSISPTKRRFTPISPRCTAGVYARDLHPLSLLWKSQSWSSQRRSRLLLPSVATTTIFMGALNGNDDFTRESHQLHGSRNRSYPICRFTYNQPPFYKYLTSSCALPYLLLTFHRASFFYFYFYFYLLFAMKTSLVEKLFSKG